MKRRGSRAVGGRAASLKKIGSCWGRMSATYSNSAKSENFSRRVKNESERAFYATSPLFSIKAFKAEPAVA